MQITISVWLMCIKVAIETDSKRGWKGGTEHSSDYLAAIQGCFIFFFFYSVEVFVFFTSWSQRNGLQDGQPGTTIACWVNGGMGLALSENKNVLKQMPWSLTWSWMPWHFGPAHSLESKFFIWKCCQPVWFFLISSWSALEDFCCSKY